MKILVASKLPPWAVGGLETYLRSLATSAKEEGACELEFLFCPTTASPPAGDKGDYAALYTAVISPRTEKFAFRMASRPHLHGLLEFYVTARMSGPLRSLAQRKDFSAVHFVGTGWDLAGFALLRLAHRLKIPFTVCPFMHPRSWGDDAIDLRLYRLADTVFCQTKFERDYLTEREVSRQRIVLTGQPAAIVSGGEPQPLRQNLQIGDRPAVLFMGRRDEGKGYPALLKAWPLVLRKCPDAVLLIAGPGGECHASLLENLPSDSFRDLGIVSGKPKADAVAACDIFCLPSAHESFGIVYVEAWTYAKPVICGTAPACRELIENGVTGLHASQDPEELAGKVCELLLNVETAAQMGRAGRSVKSLRYEPLKLLALHLSAWRADSQSAA